MIIQVIVGRMLVSSGRYKTRLYVSSKFDGITGKNTTNHCGVSNTKLPLSLKTMLEGHALVQLMHS
jgi:hypothetical protein